MSAENKVFEVIADLMTKEDIPEILQIEKESFTAPWSEGMFVGEINNSISYCICARAKYKNESILAGYIIFWMVSPEIHLHNLAVKNEFRRQHLAFTLLDVMDDIGRNAGAKAVTLEVRPSNTEAIKLDEKRGFVVKETRNNYYTETGEDALVMWADIKPSPGK